MDLQRLRYFVAVAEELHFTRAAQRLYLDQGALSAAIRRLERELGVLLFERTSRRVELTPAGAALLPGARQLVRDADALMVQVREERRRDTLRVGLFLGTLAASELTRPILGAFRAMRPDLRVQVVELGLTDWLAALRNGRVDTALLRLPTGADDIAVTPLFTEPRVVLLPRCHPMADASHITHAELAGLQQDQWYRAPAGSGQSGPFEQYYQLSDLWDLADLRWGSTEMTSGWAIIDAVAAGGYVTASALSTARWFDQDAVAAPLLTGAPGAIAAVAWRRGDDRPVLEDFAAAARATTGKLIGLVPEAAVVCDAAA